MRSAQDLCNFSSGWPPWIANVCCLSSLIFLQRRGFDCTGVGPCGKQPIWFEQVCLFDVLLSSEEDRKNKTKHLRLSRLATRTAWSKTKTELIVQAQKTKTSLSCHATWHCKPSGVLGPLQLLSEIKSLKKFSLIAYLMQKKNIFGLDPFFTELLFYSTYVVTFTDKYNGRCRASDWWPFGVTTCYTASQRVLPSCREKRQSRS